MRAASAAIVGSLGLAGTSAANGRGGRKGRKRFTICHRPPGNPSNGQTLELPKSAAKAHLKQHKFDSKGPCEDRKDAS